MKLLLFCALAFTAAGTCHAQLGQSEEASAAAYGKPLGARTSPASKVKDVTYRTDNYDISAGFKDGKAIYFIYKKLSGAAWTDTEIQSVLAGHRLGNDKWKWMKYIGTGRSGPAIHTGASKHVDAAQEWHIFAHDDYSAQYYPAKSLLLILDASGGMDAAAILGENSF